MQLPLAFLVVALLIALRDIQDLAPGAALYLMGAVCVVGCGASSIDSIAGLLSGRLRRAWTAGLLVLLASLVPTAFALVRYIGARDSLSWHTPAAVLAFGLLLLLLMRWLNRRVADDALVFASCWSSCFLALFMVAHHETGTLLSVRPHTEKLHLALYLGTWSFGLPFALAAGLRTNPVPKARRLRAGLALLAIAFGAASLELDRYWFVDLYSAIHIWLGITGLLFASLGASTLWALTIPERVQASRLRFAPLGAMTLGAVAFFTVPPGATNPRLRASLAESSFGLSILELLPDISDDGSAVALHPALNYAQHLDVSGPAQKFNILLVTVDALRADQLEKMPLLSEVASESTVFSRAYAQGSRTAIGTGTLMTGRYSAHLDWRLWVYRGGKLAKRSTLAAAEDLGKEQRFVFTTLPVVKRGTLLAERLQRAGYATIAVPFASNDEFFRRDLVFSRGFDRFIDLTDKKWKAPTSERIVDLCLEELANVKKRPWFQWVHLFDTHEAGKSREKYDRYASAVDTALGRLVASLKESGDWDNTVFALLADHGQAFGEHRHFGHATSLYEEQVRVPFVLRVPGIRAQRLDEPVAVVDATATLVVLAGAKTARLDGVNLLPIMTGAVTPEPRPIFTELHRYLSNKGERTADFKSVILGDFKLISNRKRKTSQLFNLRVDPLETHDTSEEEPEKYQELQLILKSFLVRAEREHPLP